MSSNFISEQDKGKVALAQRSALAKNIMDQCWALKGHELPPLEMMNIIGSYDATHFKQNMVQFFSEFYWRSLLSPSSNVIDIGCGCGRLALPIAKLIEDGRYYGVDVWNEGIDWCRSAITSIQPRAQFFTAAAENNYYFQERKTGVKNQFNVGFAPTGTIDFAFAISLFSHLTADDALSYYIDVNRALKPSGILYITGFVIDEFFREYQEKTGAHSSLKEEEPGCFYAYRGQDFFSGFTMDKWRQMLHTAGFQILSFELGSWAKKPGARPYQDTFVVGKYSR